MKIDKEKLQEIERRQKEKIRQMKDKEIIKKQEYETP